MLILADTPTCDASHFPDVTGGSFKCTNSNFLGSRCDLVCDAGYILDIDPTLPVRLFYIIIKNFFLDNF